MTFFFRQRDSSVQSSTSRPWSGSFDFFAKTPPNPRLPAARSARRRSQRSSDLEAPSQSGYSFDSAVSFSESVPEEDSADESTDGDDSAISDSGSSTGNGRGCRSPLSALPRPMRVLDVRADMLTRVSRDVSRVALFLVCYSKHNSPPPPTPTSTETPKL